MQENPTQPKGEQLDLDKLNQYLRGKIGRCPLCGAQNSFTALPYIMELRQFFNGDFVVGGPAAIMPVAVLSCANCGNTQLINAIQAKLLTSSGEGKEKGGA